jgi:hypothetical protein
MSFGRLGLPRQWLVSAHLPRSLRTRLHGGVRGLQGTQAEQPGLNSFVSDKELPTSQRRVQGPRGRQAAPGPASRAPGPLGQQRLRPPAVPGAQPVTRSSPSSARPGRAEPPALRGAGPSQARPLGAHVRGGSGERAGPPGPVRRSPLGGRRLRATKRRGRTSARTSARAGAGAARRPTPGGGPGGRRKRGRAPGSP